MGGWLGVPPCKLGLPRLITRGDHCVMTAVSVLPVVGEVLFDARDDGRALRVSWHPLDDLCVLSIWRDGRCVATFQLARLETPDSSTSLCEDWCTRRRRRGRQHSSARFARAGR